MKPSPSLEMWRRLPYIHWIKLSENLDLRASWGESVQEAMMRGDHFSSNCNASLLLLTHLILLPPPPFNDLVNSVRFSTSKFCLFSLWFVPPPSLAKESKESKSTSKDDKGNALCLQKKRVLLTCGREQGELLLGLLEGEMLLQLLPFWQKVWLTVSRCLIWKLLWTGGCFSVGRFGFGDFWVWVGCLTVGVENVTDL